jgi:hypothetical protein
MRTFVRCSTELEKGVPPCHPWAMTNGLLAVWQFNIHLRHLYDISPITCPIIRIMGSPGSSFQARGIPSDYIIVEEIQVFSSPVLVSSTPQHPPSAFTYVQRWDLLLDSATGPSPPQTPPPEVRSLFTPPSSTPARSPRGCSWNAVASPPQSLRLIPRLFFLPAHPKVPCFHPRFATFFMAAPLLVPWDTIRQLNALSVAVAAHLASLSEGSLRALE